MPSVGADDASCSEAAVADHIVRWPPCSRLMRWARGIRTIVGRPGLLERRSLGSGSLAEDARDEMAGRAEPSPRVVARCERSTTTRVRSGTDHSTSSGDGLSAVVVDLANGASCPQDCGPSWRAVRRSWPPAQGLPGMTSRGPVDWLSCGMRTSPGTPKRVITYCARGCRDVSGAGGSVIPMG